MEPAIDRGRLAARRPDDDALAAARARRRLPRARQRRPRRQARGGRARATACRSPRATSSWPTTRPGSSPTPTPRRPPRPATAQPRRFRRYGPVPVALLVGRVWFRYAPLRRFGRIRRPRPPRAAAGVRLTPAATAVLGERRLRLASSVTSGSGSDDAGPARSRRSRRAGPRARRPASRTSSSRVYSEKRSVAGSRPSASQRARTSTIRSAMSSASRNT